MLDIDGRTERIEEIDRRLKIYFVGFPPRYRLLDPVSQLVMSMLGGHTYGHISRAAHRRLIRMYDSWSHVRDAGSEAVYRAIRPVTYAEDKASNLVRTLHILSEKTGAPSLDFLAPLTTQIAQMHLMALPGVGPKVSAAVLNTSTMRRRALVIDIHHLRLLIRLGFLSDRATFDAAYRTIMPLLPERWAAERIDRHHMFFKRLGQVHCRPNDPHCHACPLSPLCPSAQSQSAIASTERAWQRRTA